MTEAILRWLVVYAGLCAIVGFGLLVIRGFTGRAWSGLRLLRASVTISFILMVIIWLLTLLRVLAG